MKLLKTFVLLAGALIICGAGVALAQEEPIQQNNSAAVIQNNASIPVLSQTKSYNVSLKFENNELSYDTIKLIDEPMPPQTIKPSVGWRCEVIGVDNTILDSFLFAIPTTTCTDILNKDDSLAGGCASEEKAVFTLAVPYYENGIAIQFISPDGKKNPPINTIGFAKLCADYICESNENYNTCPQDCRSGVKDGYCDGAADGVCDSDCLQDQDTDCAKLAASAPTQQTKSNISSVVVWSLIIVIIIAAVALIIIKKKKHNASNSNSNATT